MNEAQTKKLYLVSGNDEFAIKSKAREIIRSLCGEIPENNSALEVINGSEESGKADSILGSFISSIQTPAFLSPEKVVWLKNFAYFDEALSEKKYTPLIENILDMVKGGISDDLKIVIDGPGIDRRKSFYKEISKHGEIHFMEKADISDREFLKKQSMKIRVLCDEEGMRVEEQAVNYLSEVLGSDTGRIKNELEKLFNYVGKGKAITIEDCRAICSKTPEALFWSFSEALSSRNIVVALEQLNTFIEQSIREKGSENSVGTAIALLKFAAKSFNEMIKVKAAATELNLTRSINKNYFYSVSPDLKEKYKDNFLLGLNPFRAFKLYEGSMNFPEAELVRALQEILNANKKLVSGAQNPQMVLEQLTLSIAGKKNSAKAYG